MKSAWKKIFAIIGIICCLGTSAASVLADTEQVDTDTTVTKDTATASEETSSYFNYYNSYIEYGCASDVIELIASKATTENEIKKVDSREALILEDEKAYAEWQFEVKEEGLYSIYTTYIPQNENIKNIELSVSLDGQLPFLEAENLSLPRIWVDEDIEDGFSKDNSGNDLTPKQIQKFRWNTAPFSDALGMYSEPYMFYLTSGTHTLKISDSSDSVAIEKLSLMCKAEPPSYSEYIAQYKKADYAKGDFTRIEAENAAEKTSSTLYPIYDRSNAATYPNDPYYIKMNTIGGSNWLTCGDSISWTVDVPKDGLYELSFRARQNFSEGMDSYRRIYINGEVPFKEAEYVKFHYDSGWYIKTVGDDEPMLFYLKKGDVLTLECTSGPMDYPLREVQQAVLDLNTVYRDIIMVTGTSPSIYQDYELEAQLPNLVNDITSICDRLDLAVDAITEEIGTASTGASTIVKAVKIFRELAEDTFYVPDRLGNFKSAIESLASLLLSLGGQALELDSIYFVPTGTEKPSANAGLFQSLSYSIRRFMATFVGDYNTIGSAGGEQNLLVWADLGRDQAQILNRLIEEQFTLDTGISVQLNLVTGASTLIKAALAGKGPDVALHVETTIPVNLAARGALVDISKYGLDELEDEIYPSAWVPFKYQSGIYGIPVTQACDLIFYRTDIFESLGLEAPDTWDEFYRVLEVLQSKNLGVALPEVNSADQGASAAINTFNKFLFQSGGDYYTEDLSKTLFDTEVAYKAFEKTVELYRTYGISRDVNAFNRFRSGEAPLAFSSYIMYTQLVSSAPEIRGLWDFALIPGTVMEDGSIDRTSCAGSSGCVMMQQAVDKKVDSAAFEFMKWWAGSEAQTEYGKALEGVLGIIGRITPANRVTLSKLGWSDDEFEIIDHQLSISYNQPQVVGNYQISRSLTSAIRAAINDENTPRRALALYNKDINDEITRKRQEFNLD